MSSSRDIVVDSPPGSTRPSTSDSSAARRTGTARGAGRPERGEVLAHVALQREHTDERTSGHLLTS